MKKQSKILPLSNTSDQKFSNLTSRFIEFNQIIYLQVPYFNSYILYSVSYHFKITSLWQEANTQTPKLIINLILKQYVQYCTVFCGENYSSINDGLNFKLIVHLNQLSMNLLPKQLLVVTTELSLADINTTV